MKTPMTTNETDHMDDVHDRFMRHRHQATTEVSLKWRWVGSLLVLLVLLVASVNTHAQLPDPGMQIDPARYKPLIEDGKTIISSPHKVYGPETNDLVLQLRKRGIDKVILGGMSANLCTESHMRELMEQGFEVAVVSDATAAIRSSR